MTQVDTRLIHAVLAAGGTGGHVFPAEALAEKLMHRGARLTLMTDRRGAAYGGTLGSLETVRIRSSAVSGRGVLGQISGAFNLGLGFLQAIRHLKRLKPDVVVGFGGYASLPPLLAATHLKIPTLIHEQNAIPGRANRLLAGRVSCFSVAFPLVLPPKEVKTVVTGMPVRPAVLNLKDREYIKPDPNGPFRLLVTGGSQGAQVFSTLLPDALALLPDAARARLHLTQQCRPETLEATRLRYQALGIRADLAAFYADLPDRLADAHLVLCRSGASTIGELAVLGRPAILVPYPHATDDHQTANARVMSEAGGGWLMPQGPLTPRTLADRIEGLMLTPDALVRASDCARAVAIPDASVRLADLALETAHLCVFAPRTEGPHS